MAQSHESEEEYDEEVGSDDVSNLFFTKLSSEQLHCLRQRGSQRAGRSSETTQEKSQKREKAKARGKRARARRRRPGAHQ